MARGFLLGATAGRTTLNGEGLQHEDGHSLLLAATNPAVVPYDPAFAYELGYIVEDGLHRMYGETDAHPQGENVIYYLTVYNEPHLQPASPRTSTSRACSRASTTSPYRRRSAAAAATRRGRSSSPPASACRGRRGAAPARRGLGRGRRRLVGDVVERAAPRRAWPPRSATCCTPPSRAAGAVRDEGLEDVEGPVVAVSDFMRAVPNQIARGCPATTTPWAPTGSGSPTPGPRRAGTSTSTPSRSWSAALQALAERGEVKRETVQEAFDKYRIDDPTAVRGVKQEGGDA